MGFEMGIVVGVIGMLFLQCGLLTAFALKEIYKGCRKGMKGIETTEKTDT